MATQAPAQTQLYSSDAAASPAASVKKLPLFSVFLAHISVDMQTSSLTVLLPLLLASFGLNYSLAALIVSVNNLVIAVAQPLFGIVGDRKPMRWLMFAGAMLCGVAMVSVTLLPSYWLVLVAVVLSGLGSAAFHPEGLSAVRATSGDKPASGTSFFFFGGNLGFALGPFLATLLIAAYGTPGALGMLVPTLLATGALFLQRRAFGARAGVAGGRLPGAAPSASVRRAFWLVVFLLALIAVRSLILSGLQTFIPLYFTGYSDLSKERIGAMVSVLIFSGAFGTLLGGPISERIGRRNTMCLAMLIVLAALFVFLRTEGLVQLIAIGIAGAFITMPWPISVVMVQEAMPNNVGLAGGLTLGLAYGASGLGVSMLGGLADATGLPAVMTLITLLPILVFFMSLFVPERPGAPRSAGQAAGN
ncbi:MAG: MFS transporter [Anaerolineae bacterium]|nr:MFS transporter [Candidatus Roseilinea sp.]MDW8449872.1 MFS transporter [Anaerolineae bacterium]